VYTHLTCEFTLRCDSKSDYIVLRYKYRYSDIMKENENKKDIRITLDESDYIFLRQLKGEMPWKNFMLAAAKNFDIKKYIVTEISRVFSDAKEEFKKEPWKSVVLSYVKDLAISVVLDNDEKMYEALNSLIFYIKEEESDENKDVKEKEHSIEDILNAKPVIDNEQ